MRCRVVGGILRARRVSILPPEHRRLCVHSAFRHCSNGLSATLPGRYLLAYDSGAIAFSTYDASLNALLALEPQDAFKLEWKTRAVSCDARVNLKVRRWGRGVARHTGSVASIAQLPELACALAAPLLAPPTRKTDL
eukprot:scaffold194338_cov28-Tisochrysis_lutea.AAC.6